VSYGIGFNYSIYPVRWQKYSDIIGRISLLKERSKKKLRGLSPQANYTDRATAAVGEVASTFAGRGCYVVSATDSHGR
jgi:hypothetical protein